MRRTSRTVAVLAASTAFLVGGAAAWAANGLTANGAARRLAGDQTQAVRQEIKNGNARNVILLIGDGMGDSEITIARNYQYGAAGELPGIDALPLTGSYTTYALWKKGSAYAGLPDYVTDSAASGSGWSTGTKTYNGAISVDLDGVPQKTLLELAKAGGLRTGDVSTAELQDATPAVLVSHVTDRGCYGPVQTTATCPTNALELGGLGSITEQLINVRADVVLGGGATTFAQSAKAGDWTGRTLLDQAQDRGYQTLSTAVDTSLVTDTNGNGTIDAGEYAAGVTRVATASDLAGVTKADQNHPLLGLFAKGNMETRWTGPIASATGGTQAPVTCTPNPAYSPDQPTLAQMTSKAIELLNDKRAKKGFFLQVEGASIDKQDHASNACAQIGETIDLDEAVQVALDFAKKDGNTLVILTADHAHTSQIVYPNTTTPGATITLLTADGAPMTVSYATAPVTGSQDHTGTQVRIAAYGPGAANVVGLTDQTDVFFTVKNLLKLDQKAPFPPNPKPGKGWPSNWYGWKWYGWSR